MPRIWVEVCRVLRPRHTNLRGPASGSGIEDLLDLAGAEQNLGQADGGGHRADTSGGQDDRDPSQHAVRPTRQREVDSFNSGVITEADHRLNRNSLKDIKPSPLLGFHPNTVSQMNFVILTIIAQDTMMTSLPFQGN